MNLVNYQVETWRTCPDLGSEGANLSHMTLGMSSEYSELLEAKHKRDWVNVAEEISDQFWYLSNYCNFREYLLSDLWDEAQVELEKINLDNYTVENYFYCLSRLQDLAKKRLAYDKPIDRDKEKDCLLSVIITMHVLWKDFNFDLERGLQNNIDKLRKRFPDKFDKTLAVNRNLDAERAELEK